MFTFSFQINDLKLQIGLTVKESRLTVYPYLTKEIKKEICPQ